MAGFVQHSLGDLLTEREAAERLTVSTAALRRWRLEGYGPRFVRLGSLVRYPAASLEMWLEENLS